jgi:hypothetical protein
MRTVESLLAAGLDPAILRTQRRTIVYFLEGFRVRWQSAEDYAWGAGVTVSELDAFRHNQLTPADQGPL